VLSVPGIVFRAMAVVSGAAALGLAAAKPVHAVDPTIVRGSATSAGAARAVSAGDSGAKTGPVGPVVVPIDPIDSACLSRTICSIKNKIRWGTPAWSQEQCQTVANAILTSAKRYDVSPTLLLAVAINESDLNEKAARVSMRDQKIYAKDSGLMGIRCVLGSRGQCLNGNVRGMKWADLMVPTNNIDSGAKELAYWKNGGAFTRTIVKRRDASGTVRAVYKTTPCHHKTHAYWAHYNHGPRYIDHGYARHYPHRVAVLDHALASVLHADAPELRGNRITMHDAGKRERTVDRPIEPRYQKLCSQIQSVNGTCAAVALN
jgi:hypothetical protein